MAPLPAHRIPPFDGLLASARSEHLRALLIGISDAAAASLVRRISDGGYAVFHKRVETEDAFIQKLASDPWDVILSTTSLPGFSALRARQLVTARGLDIPVIIVSPVGEEAAAAQAMRQGVSDYVLVNDLARLLPAIERELRVRSERVQSRDDHARLEEQFQAAQRLEAVGRLAGGVAHDFNNILSIISSYASFLADDLVSEPAATDIRAIQEATRRAASLISQLLAFSRRQILQPEVIDLNAGITELKKMLQRVIGEDIHLQTRLQPDLGSVKADPAQMDQVLVNLVVNARDAMPNGGTLIIETFNADVDDAQATAPRNMDPGPYVVLLVRDTGVGMTKEVLANIFEPFFSTKGRGKGTGLGLSTVHGIIKQSEGYIFVNSGPGVGTCFEIFLPRVSQAPSRRSLSQPPSHLTGRETVLIVEDDSELRAVSRRILKGAGYTVLEAGSGDEAVEIMKTHPMKVDLLLTDVVMPGISGPEAAQILRGLQPSLRVLFTSGYADDTTLSHRLTEVRQAFLAKPFTPFLLLQRVRETLEGD